MEVDNPTQPAAPQEERPEGRAETPPETLSKPTEVLPTRRIAFGTQLDLLRAYGAAGDDGGVTNERLAGLVGLHAKTASLANAFFTDIGFIHRGERGNIPAPEVIEYHRAHRWDPDNAAHQLAPLLRQSWFYAALRAELAYESLKENQAIAILGRRANAVKHRAPELRLLLDYLEAGGLISRENGMVTATDDRRTAGGPAPVSRTAEPEPPREGMAPRGSLPLLIQGLLEQLPHERRWSRAQADKWLELAKLTFEVVYDFDDDVGKIKPEAFGE